MAMRIWVVLVAVMGVAHADPHFDPFAHAHAPAVAEAARPASDRAVDPATRSAELLARFAPPPLEPALERRVAARLDVRGTRGGIIGDRGDRQYFNERVTGTTQVWRQDGPMKWPVQLSAGEDATTVVALSPDEKWLVVSRGEPTGLYVMQPDGGRLRVVTQAPHARAELAYVTDDSKALYFATNDLDPASNAIYRWDLADGTKSLVFDEPGRWRVVDHLGDRWLMEKQLGDAHVEVYEYELATKKLTPLLGQGEVHEFDVRYGARPAQVLVRTNKVGDFEQLYTLEAGKLAPIGKPSPHDVSAFAIDDARSRIYYTEYVDGYSRLHAIDAKTLRTLELPRLPDAENQTFAGASRNGRFVQITIDSARLAPTTVVLDWKSRKLETWRLPATPEIDVSAFAPVSLETYSARDGTTISMYVRRPATCEEPCPVIVEVHAGPKGRQRPGFDPYAQLFVDAGFVFVQPNVRGSNGYGNAWQHAGDGPKRLAVITDIEDASHHIRTAWAKDGKAPKIGILGPSSGGYAALIAMTHVGGAFDAGVADYPMKDDDALDEVSPVAHLANLKAPLLVMQGIHNPRTPIGEALQIHDELEHRGVPGELILFPDDGPGAAKRSNLVLQVGHELAFFERYLR